MATTTEGIPPASPIDPPFFCFTLDTEPDNLWEPFTGVRFEHFARLCDFHRTLVDHGAKPVYLTTSEVAEDPGAARVLDRILATGRAELGAHFHTWTRPWPFEVPPLGSPPLHAMAHRLGQPVEERMLRFTCSALEKCFGVRPVSYRGGRWSFGPDTTRSLRNAGIHIDSTITPGMTWQDDRHPLLDGPDYRAFPRHPFYLRADSPGPQADHGDVLEVPVGTGVVSAGALAGRRGLIGRAARKLYRWMGWPHGCVWLRPTLMTRGEMRACLETLRQDRVPVWVAMIHSSEIIPCRPCPTEAVVRQFIRRCLDLIDDAIALGATAATLVEVRRQIGAPAPAPS
jgi:hypothetical protein